MDVTTIILGCAAAYLLLKNSSTSETLQTLQTKVTELEDDAALEDLEDEAEAAESDVTSKIQCVGFCGIIGNYYTSDKYVSAAWYLKFKNTSNQNLTVNLKSLSVTILNSRQIWGNEKFNRNAITIPANSTSEWINVAWFDDGPLYGYATVGKDIQNSGKSRVWEFYDASATVTYTVSNPYINNGLASDTITEDMTNQVYGIKVWTGAKVSEVENWVFQNADKLINAN